MSEPKASGQKCSAWERNIEVCACCAEPEGEAAICNGCLRLAIGQGVPQPHAHGG